MGNPSFSHRGDRILVQYYDDKSSEWKVGIISAVAGKLLETADISLAKQGFPLFSPDDRSLIYGHDSRRQTRHGAWPHSVRRDSGPQLPLQLRLPITNYSIVYACFM